MAASSGIGVMIGQTLAHYRILEKIGAGGMGEVYRAHDERLDRDIALKVLPAATFADPTARARLLREARTASQLNHPHICTIYEVGEAEGQAYIAMELVEGQVLSARLAGGALPAEQVLRYGLHLAEALAHAHERGVIHRDLKSANVIITAEGRAKVLDFGLAKHLSGEKLGGATTQSQASLTQPGALVGTLAYVAPEQLRGQPADARSDIWTLGVLLYEMAAGQRPFQGHTGYELSSMILREAPARLPKGVPTGLQAVIQRSLAKEPGQRYQRASEVRAALEAIQPEMAAPRPRRLAARARRLAPKRIRALAVLPLANLSRDPEQEYFADGMTDELIAQLAQIHALRVISRTSAMRYKGTNKSVPEIAQELKVDAVVEGSVLRSGGRVRITAQLIHAPTDRHLWAQSFERDLQDVLTLQSEIGRAIAHEIQVKLTSQEQARLASARPVNPEAYEAYLKGRYHLYRWSAEASQQALAHFEQALGIDPTYAPAYAGIADAHMNLGTGLVAVQPATAARPKGKVAALKALEIDANLAEGHAALGATHLCYDWDWVAAEREYRRALQLNPNHAPPHQWYSLLFAVRGQVEEALEAAKRAQQLDILAPYPSTLVGQILYYARRYEQAREQLQKVVERDPEFILAHYWLGQTLLAESANAEALAELQAAVRLSGGSPVMLGALGHAYGVAGRVDEARKLLKELHELCQQRYVPAYNLAEIYASLREQEKALEYLTKAETERTDLLIFLAVDPVWDGLRSDPRFQELLRRMNLPE